MKSILKKVTGLALIATLTLGMFSCSNGSTDDPVIVPECVLVTGGTVTGADYTDNYTGVFPAGREVTLSSFYMGKYEVTQAEYKSVMEGQKVSVGGTEYTLADSPSYCVQGSAEYGIDSEKDHANHPVENVTWFDAVYYCNALSAKENLDPCYTISVTEVRSGHITVALLNMTKQRTATVSRQKQNGNMQLVAETQQNQTGTIHLAEQTRQKELHTIIQRMPDWTVQAGIATTTFLEQQEIQK